MNKLTDWLSTEDRRIAFAEEALIVDVAEQLWAAMACAHVTKSQIADRLGKSKAFISQMLDGTRNMTLRSLADIAHCIGYRVQVSLQPQSAIDEWRPLNDAIVVQFNQSILAPAPVEEADVKRGAWTAIRSRVAA